MKNCLSYDQLRRILALVHDNPLLKAKLDEFMSGKLTSVSETDLLGLIKDSKVDMDLIAIMTGHDADEMDAMDGLEAISDFFGYIRANKDRLKNWLASIGYAVVTKEAKTPLKPSK